MRRREFLRRATAAAAGVSLAPVLPGCGDGSGGGGPAQGRVAHVLATASHDRIRLKASLLDGMATGPELRVDGRRIAGLRTDTEGRFWAFEAHDLEPGRAHALELRAGRRHLTEPWSMSTFPPPGSRPERLRLLAYTCAGGHDAFGLYVPVPLRRRLLERGLSFGPDAIIANGDHVYWDLRAGLGALVTGGSEKAREIAGVFDRDAPVLGHANEGVLKRAVDAQIAALYGTAFRSVPVFFLRDDHDYFEDDRVTPDLTTFPPDAFMRRLGRATQWLYYPEFLPAPGRPEALAGSGAPDRPAGTSEAFGTLRFGDLAELLLYDCKGFLEVRGEAGGLVPRGVEEWIVARLGDSTVRHVVNVPSNPPGWSAGKYAEWYPDVVVDGELTTARPKSGWQAGWLEQHDRLLRAAASRPAGVPLFLSGDLHGIGELRILRAGAADLRSNPVGSLVAGTPGTGAGWPSAARGIVATPPSHLEVEEIVPMQETNGFHLVDIERNRVVVRHFRLRPSVGAEAIDALEPFAVSERAV